MLPDADGLVAATGGENERDTSGTGGWVPRQAPHLVAVAFEPVEQLQLTRSFVQLHRRNCFRAQMSFRARVRYARRRAGSEGLEYRWRSVVCSCY